MSSKSSIEWTGSTWTAIRARVKPDAAEIATQKGYSSLVQIAGKMAGHVGPHCEHVSDGCARCYSDTNNSRCLPTNGTGLPFDRRSRDLVDVFVDEKILVQPLHWRAPRKIFVCSQTDLFAEFVTDEMIDRVFAVMALCSQHTFQVLTKRAERMREWAKGKRFESVMTEMRRMGVDVAAIRWPLPNIWLGVSVENQEYADKRIPYLLRTPVAKRFVSYEPAIGPVNFDLPRCDFHDREHAYLDKELRAECCSECRANGAVGELSYGHWLDPLNGGIAWVIAGAESGHGARPADEDWFRTVKDQCVDAGVKFFYKQKAINGRKISTPELDGRTWTEFPA